MKEVAGYYPVVTITGPRQSGKTTLCRQTFPDKAYVSLEPLDVQASARRDPRGFLAALSDGAILDEAHNVPELFSYLHEEVDRDSRPGRFVVTGSRHLGLTESVTQSLAGRTAMLQLMPPSYDELQRFRAPPTSLFEVLWTGAYPRIHHKGIPAARFLADYLTTYVQRDVRQLKQIGDLASFTTFLQLCASRTGQLLNLSALGADSGITHNTAKAWLSVLEAGYLVVRLPPWHSSPSKRLLKTPKLHFLDSGLACNLLGIRSPEELRLHHARGAVFESWVVSELYKRSWHRGFEPRLAHYRDQQRLEVDLVLDLSARLLLVEMKSGATVAKDFTDALDRLAALVARRGEKRPVVRRLVFGGIEAPPSSHATLVPWAKIHDLSWEE
jgi:predicted AAA+ superfamily ATPase